MQEYFYSQALEYYKDNLENFKQQNKNMFFKKDGDSSHTSKIIKDLFEKLFGDNLIQNAPHFPYITYPIETLWDQLKKRVKEIRAKNLDEFKLIATEEWNKIPKSFIQKIF